MHQGLWELLVNIPHKCAIIPVVLFLYISVLVVLGAISPSSTMIKFSFILSSVLPTKNSLSRIKSFKEFSNVVAAFSRDTKERSEAVRLLWRYRMHSKFVCSQSTCSTNKAVKLDYAVTFSFYSFALVLIKKLIQLN